MKWRDRISILSRKRNHGNVGHPVNRQNDLPSGSGIAANSNLASNSAPVESVENTLSQLRPVIGPDHKSYYILLRGDEDSFMCIQPAKDVINSLDEVVKNVISTVKLAKPPLQGAELSSNAKRPRYSQAKTYTSTLNHKQISNIRRNGIRSSAPTLLNEEEKVGSSVALENVFLSKAGSSSPVMDNVVENVILNRTLVYPFVQNRLRSNGTVNVNTKQESCLFISSDYGNESGSDSLIMPATEAELIQNIAQSDSSLRKSDCKVGLAHTENTSESHVAPQSYLRQALEAVGSDAKDVTLAVTGQTATPTELCLVAKEGTVLTEEEITSQIKTLIESEQLIVEEDSQIVVIRVSAREAMVKIVLNENEIVEVLGQHQEVEDNTKLARTKQDVTIKDEVIVEDRDSLSLPISEVTEGDCYSGQVLEDSKDHTRDMQYLLSHYSQSDQDFSETKEIAMDPSLQESVDQTPDYVVAQSPHCVVDETPHCVVEPLVEPPSDPLMDNHQEQTDQADELDKIQYEVDGIESIGDSLISGTEGEIVVFQREDGTFVNQDGTPVSSELQYLITSSELVIKY
ncbi:uncharacterized protein LOC121873700 [Homarus americanus]|uniref:uncharacterized protein LOC121873700 n=1 Tax=Homarus americanus TaxID=6706 RepID=UPI001C45CEF8|nr:uncharacterized protein LOC121873700 [Homarus americanus]